MDRKRRVFIGGNLDPDESPEQEGRYRFTLAHEIGHRYLLTSPQRIAEFRCRDEATARLCPGALLWGAMTSRTLPVRGTRE